jgi:hypothetical protein
MNLLKIEKSGDVNGTGKMIKPFKIKMREKTDISLKGITPKVPVRKFLNVELNLDI